MVPSYAQGPRPEPPEEVPMPANPKPEKAPSEAPQPEDPQSVPTDPEVPDREAPDEDPSSDPFDHDNRPV